VADLSDRVHEKKLEFGIEEMRTDPSLAVELDKEILRSLDFLKGNGVEKPLAAMAVWICFFEREVHSHSAKLLAARVCCTAALLGQFRWVKMLVVDDGVDPKAVFRLDRTLFESQNILEPQVTVQARYDFLRKHLVMRGILKQKNHSR